MVCTVTVIYYIFYVLYDVNCEKNGARRKWNSGTGHGHVGQAELYVVHYKSIKRDL
jgi:hypothetical protein